MVLEPQDDEAGMKARDIIPGWPRGRSTSRPLAKGSVWPWNYVHSLISGEVIAVIQREELPGLSRRPYLNAPYFDHATAALDWAARAEERVGNQVEEQRKAEMMEAWYEVKRWEAGGNLKPQPLGEWITSLLLSSYKDLKLVKP